MCLSALHHSLRPRPQLPPALVLHQPSPQLLCLALLALQVLVCTESKTGANEDNCVKADARSGPVAGRCSRRGGCGNLRFWVSLLKDKRSASAQAYFAHGPTWRFNVPTTKPSKNLACLITVSNIRSQLQPVLSTNIEQNFFSASADELAIVPDRFLNESNRTEEKARVGSFPAFWHMKRGIADLELVE